MIKGTEIRRYGTIMLLMTVCMIGVTGRCLAKSIAISSESFIINQESVSGSDASHVDSIPANEPNNAQKQQIYEENIRKGDWAFTYGRYVRASNYYKKALTAKPGEAYPVEQLNVINRILKNQQIPYLFPNLNFEKPSALILFLLIVIIYSVLTMIILLVFILFNRGRRYQEEDKTNSLREKFQSLLVDYLYETDQSAALKDKINKLSGTKQSRQILIDEVIDLSINLKGEESEKLQSLYYEFKLDRETLLKANSKRWHIKIKGFREIAFMNLKEARPVLIKALASKNDILRMEAQITLVRMNDDDPFSFLDHLERPFTLWEQNNIHELLVYHNLKVPRFERWIRSTNKTVAVFALNMIRILKQEDSEYKVALMLMHDDEEVRKTAIRTLGGIQSEDTATRLISHYPAENYDNKLEILRTLGKLHLDENIPFFKNVIEHEDRVWLQIEAAKGIEKLGESGRNELQALLDSEEYRNYQIILKHVLDKRI